MEKEFVPYELALELRELGFKERCIALWYWREDLFLIGEEEFYIRETSYFEVPEHHVLAPLWQQAFEFILTKLDLEINYNSKYELNFDGEFNLYKLTWIDYEGYSSEFDTEGNENCLKKLIKIVKKKS